MKYPELGETQEDHGVQLLNPTQAQILQLLRGETEGHINTRVAHRAARVIKSWNGLGWQGPERSPKQGQALHPVHGTQLQVVISATRRTGHVALVLSMEEIGTSRGQFKPQVD